MDFTLGTEQTDLRASMAAFGAAHLGDAFRRRAEREGFDRATWSRCCDEGITALVTPAEYGGGAELDVLSGVLAMEGLGHGSADNGMPFALNTHIWTVQHPILAYGSDEQKSRYLPDFCAGRRIGAHAMTEPDAGSDSSAMQTTATPCAGGYRLDGQKCLITLAPVADVFVLFATVDASLGKWGITAFLVDGRADGVQASDPVIKMGLRSVPMGSVTLHDVFVPAEDRLGPEGAGASIANVSLETERCCILGSQIGRMQRQLEDAIAHARQRQQFGRPIGDFQSVSNRIADMKVRLETARLLLYKVAWMKSRGESAALESAMLKLYVSEQFLASGLDAVRLRGGIGYTEEGGVEHDVRDALGGVLYAGTSDIQRNIIAGMLGL